MTFERPSAAMLRSEQRFETRLSARVESGAYSLPVQLRDLSRCGALAEAARPPDPGSVVRLRNGRFEVEATVVWAKRTRFGLRFVEPLRATELLVLLSLGREAAKNAPPPAFPTMT